MDTIYSFRVVSTKAGQDQVTYNAANKPERIVDDSGSQSGTVEFAYDADGNRVLQSVSSGDITARTVYVGLGGTGKSLYERTTTVSSTGTTTEHTYFVYAGGVHGGNAFSVRVLDDGGAVTADRYFNFDHLGSTTVVSDSVGHVQSVATSGAFTGTLGYDPWGARRGADGQAASPGATFPSISGHREFTGQEAIPGIGLINMNGRVYDPGLGRFLSPDANVQLPGDLQSYNRYSYVLNNPMRYTDPTGYFSWGGVEAALPSVFIGLAAVAACAGTGAMACGLIGITASVLTAGVARADGESWTQVGSNFIVGMASGTLGGAAGWALGGALGAAEGSAAEFAAAEVGGAVGGAIGGALLSQGSGSNLWENVLSGAAQGAVWAAVGWGMKQPAALTQSDGDESVSGGAELEKRAKRPQEGSGYKGQAVDEPASHGPFDAYDDRRTAAAAVLDAYNPLSEARNKEFAGLLYELDGDHYATPGVPGSPDGSNANRAGVYLPKGATVEGYWHTHGQYDFTLDVSLHRAGGWDWNERFSERDINFRLRSTIPGNIQNGYVGTPSGMMYEFTPGPGVTDLNVVPIQVGGSGWLGGYGFRKPL